MVSRAAQLIVEGEVEPNRIAKTVLVIDEAQDMSAAEYALVRALMTVNEEMRVIAVGDDDQNIYEFRGSNSAYMAQLLKESGGRFVEMTENYRSAQHVVRLANTFVQDIHGRMKRMPIVSMSADEGFVGVTHHASACMYEPLVREIIANRNQGTICVLTQTNEEAVILVALLRKHGLQSKLIQSMDGFRFWNMAEVRLFLKHIEARTHAPIVTEDVWEEAKRRTFEAYATSGSLHYLVRCVRLFEETNKTKYLTDFKEFVFESSVEDFCDLSGADVVVSTIHKSKGREFDDVFMLLSEPHNLTDEVLRRYYVGITRAKKRLFIHTTSSIFDRLPSDRKNIDQHPYEMPDNVVLQLSHKDVNLGFFKTRKKEILALRVGEQLRFDNGYLYSLKTHLSVAQLSQKMQKDLALWAEKGYRVSSAQTRFIVAWRPKDAPKEEKDHAVLLIDLSLDKESPAPYWR